MEQTTAEPRFMPRLAVSMGYLGRLLIALPFAFLAWAGIQAEQIGAHAAGKDGAAFAAFAYYLLSDILSLLFMLICGVLCMRAARKIHARQRTGWKLWTSLCLASFLWWGYEIPATRALIFAPVSAILFIHALRVARNQRFQAWWATGDPE